MNANAPKGKTEKSADLDPLESVFDHLEKRVEALAQRLKSALEENGKLKAAAAAGDAERERLKAELAEARKTAAKGDESAGLLKRYESERADVRARIEKLIASLEGA
jgi:septal ring factor EnvC (AmiA/AmiB activator)